MTAPDLRQQLQSALGPTFTLTRELGGGGMARVFVARDTTLERDVVVKVLSPELAAGVNVERFAREIRLAAGLQQANIVPLLSAGTSADGLPYYTMPFVEGESLRHRLAAGPLAVGEAVHVLRDVARALAYAHGRGIVHRDIKPDNVLRSAGTAVVTDFGIAKALGAARTLTDAARGDGASGGALTAFGHAIGTPAYMAPEQIAADPAADHRVDVYALGCLAYELLAGRPPFAGVPPTQLLAAHLSRPAEPVTVHRPEVPPALAALVARCLEKDPARRPATAAEVLVALDAAGTPGEGVAAPATGLARVLAGYGAAAAAVLALAWAARAAIGLPDWVLPATALLLLAGLLAVLAIAGTQRAARGAGVAAPTRTPGGTPVAAATTGTLGMLALRAAPYVSWRRARRLALAVLAAFVAVVAGWMGLRALGIGPEGSLLAAGAVRAEDRVLVADVAAPAGDSALAPILAEAVRTAMGQSRALRLVGPDEVATTLGQMRRPPGTRLEGEVAREVAQRLGAPLLLGGRVARVGGGYVVSLDLSPASGGAALASYQAAAADAQGLLGAVDELARRLRGRVGESLRLVQRAVPLEQATTSSLVALRKYTQALDALDNRGDLTTGIPLLREAVAADSTFALAWRKLAAATDFASAAVRDSALEQALRWSDRLPDRERDLVRGSYYLWHSRAADEGKAIDALRAAYRADSSMPVPINLLAGLYEGLGQYDSVARYTQRGLLVRRTASGAARHASTLLRLGRVDEAERVLDSLWRADTLWRRDWFAAVMRSDLRLARGDRDSAYAIAAALARASAAPDVQTRALLFVAREALIRGRVREAVAFAGAVDSLVVGQGGVPLHRVLTRTWADAWLLGRRAEAVRALDSLLADPRWLRAVAPADRPYATFGITYARAGRADRAEAMLARVRAEQPALERITPGLIRALRAEIAAARGDHAAAHALTRARRPLEASTSPDDQFAEAFVLDRMGRHDSALVAYERYLAIPPSRRWDADFQGLAVALKRAGELRDARGERAPALAHYRAFVALWRDADPELQPAVQAVRRRIAELERRGG